MYHNFFIHSSVEHLGCFHVLVNSAAVNIGIHVSLSILISSEYMLSIRIVGSYGGFIPRFLRNLHTILRSVCINLHFHQQCKKVLFSPDPFQHLLCVDFLMMHLEGWYQDQGGLHNLVIKLTSLIFPALGGGFFTTSATWEALHGRVLYINSLSVIVLIDQNCPKFFI